MTILKSSVLCRPRLAALALCALLLLASCKQEAEKPLPQKAAADTVGPAKPNPEQTHPLVSLSIQFLWRDSKGNLKINEAYCQKITAPEKAALGYIATFTGNDCQWDGPYTNKRDNLKCSVLTALGLGYQCSNEHLGFLRQWFSKDAEALKALENCPTVPYTATSQEALDEITITTNGNEILVKYKVSGINMREQQSWNWNATDCFEFDHNSIKLVKHDKYNVKRGHLDVGD